MPPQKQVVQHLSHHEHQLVDEVNPYNMISGSTGIQAAVDSMLMLNRRNGSYVLNVVGRDFDEQELGLSFKGVLWKIEGAAEDFFMSNQRAEIMKVLKAADGESLSPKEISEELGGKNVRQLLCAMEQAGFVYKSGYGRYLLKADDTNDMDDMDDMDDTSHSVIPEKTQDDTQDDTLDPVFERSEGSKTPSVNGVKDVIPTQQVNDDDDTVDTDQERRSHDRGIAGEGFSAAIIECLRQSEDGLDKFQVHRQLVEAGTSISVPQIDEILSALRKTDVLEKGTNGKYRLKSQSDVKLRSAPAQEAGNPAPTMSSSVLDSLTPPQKIFLSFLPIGDKEILERYRNEGLPLDPQHIKVIKKFLIGAELIEFDEELGAWQATEKCLKLRY